MPDPSVRAAVVQMLADEDGARNRARAGEWVAAAAASGARLVVLPEKWNWWGPASRVADGAEALDGPSLSAARQWARTLGIAIVAGSILEATLDGTRAYNTSVLIAADGSDVATYRKIHLFDATVGEARHRESAVTEAGDETVVASVYGMGVGLAVCYDLRFPELFREVVGRGARAIAVPANFTVATGRDHWDVLVRARAIENQCFVLASGQCGQHATGEGAWGHSMIVGPWGDVMAEVAEGEGIAVADLDFAHQDRVRTALPVLAHRRIGVPRA
ncbi:MAG: carbon-nitrogen hydrolase family protein [Thermoleophilia bacterium]|nr:carbon-nitrogen hydrolase family protein [Thermoleophilia bacterium]